MSKGCKWLKCNCGYGAGRAVEQKTVLERLDGGQITEGLGTMLNGLSYWETVKDLKQEGHKKTRTLERSL